MSDGLDVRSALADFASMRLLFRLCFVTAFIACNTAQADNEADNSAALRGAALYETYCIACHGANLAGGLAPSMVDDAWNYGNSDAEITAVIKNGIADVAMPGFGDSLSVRDMADLLAYIRRGGGDTPTFVPAIDDVPSAEAGIQIDDWATNLDQPWGFVFISDTEALVTEKPGRLWRVSQGRRQEIISIPSSVDRGQGGLLDVAIDPDYTDNGWVYLSYSHASPRNKSELMTRIVRGRIQNDEWADTQVLFEAKPEHYINSSLHFGSRITFDDSGHLFFGIGDRGQMDMAQDLTRPNGKIHRIMRDGSIPKDNPFIDTPEAYASIYSYGNRNPQGTIIHPETGVLWETEHGPRGGDELNVIKSGLNYGWPEISYGINYSGTVLTEFTALPGMEQPVSQWTPSIAVCGLEVYTGDLFPDWKGHLLVGALAYQTLRLVSINEEDYLSEITLLQDKGRVRDVTTGPDGAIYVALPDRIVRLSPKQT